MFVDYNERNIIIEDDSIKDGIRRQTLDMLQEKGGTISCFDNKLLNQNGNAVMHAVFDHVFSRKHHAVRRLR